MLCTALTVLFLILLGDVKSFHLRTKAQRGFSGPTFAMKASDSSTLGAFARKALSVGITSLALGLTQSLPVNAATGGDDVPVYFGVGCFWHVQHEFVQTERAVLGRQGLDITSRAGYAGGKSTGKDTNRPDNKKGLVCYHNMVGVGDYGQLGHGEVVGMDVPSDKVGAMADQYFALFGSDNERPDKGDRGGEYRSLLGLPGGMQSPLLKDVQASLAKSGKKLELVEGLGNDPDTLKKGRVYIMDTASYPFYPAEMYHQFHDGFMPGEQYPQSYNNIAKQLYDAGKLGPTGCPDAAPRG